MADAQTGKDAKAEVGADSSEPTPLTRMANLARRVLAVPRDEITKTKPRKRVPNNRQ